MGLRAQEILDWRKQASISKKACTKECINAFSINRNEIFCQMRMFFSAVEHSPPLYNDGHVVESTRGKNL